MKDPRYDDPADDECWSLGCDWKVTYCDDHVWQGECRRCGAELIEELDGDDEA